MCLARVATRFILEKAKSPRGGGAKRQLWEGTSQPRGLLYRRDETSEEPVRPAAYGEWSSHEVVTDPGLRLISVRGGLPCLPSVNEGD